MSRLRFRATISDPKVDLIKDSNEIGVFTNVEVIAPGGIRGAGRANIKGILSYDAKKGARFKTGYHFFCGINLYII